MRKLLPRESPDPLLGRRTDRGIKLHLVRTDPFDQPFELRNLFGSGIDFRDQQDLQPDLTGELLAVNRSKMTSRAEYPITSRVTRMMSR